MVREAEGQAAVRSAEGRSGAKENATMRTAVREEAVTGCLLGTAVGDATGLIAEGLTRRRLARMYPVIDGHRLFFGRGMVSDDTDHAVMVAEALAETAGDPALFRAALARKLKLWLLAGPPGVGLATLKACARLVVGVAPECSGVASAGNGPAMRSALIGVCYGDAPVRMADLVGESTRLTHTDPRAESGALAIAIAAHIAATTPVACDIAERCRTELLPAVSLVSAEMGTALGEVIGSVHEGQSTWDYLATIGCDLGVSGFVLHTVPVVLHVWLTIPDDYEAGMRTIIACGGDTDTTAAILGALIGARVGPDGIPECWRSGLCEWPHSVCWMERLGQTTARAAETGAPQPWRPSPWPARLVRNAFFGAVVIVNGLRRLLPPY